MNATPAEILREREDNAAILNAARDGLVYLPLGGAGEIGMNFYLYGCRGKWIAVECGITFGDETMPGLDVIMANPRFIVENAKDLLGIVLTHAHEDHLGAVPHLWRQLRAPLYATPFAAGLLKAKLAEAGLTEEAEITEVPLGGHLDLGAFAIDFVTVTHSIPEPNALAIKTPFGTIVHTGDWKIDPEPMIGQTIDKTRLSQLGDEGVLAMVCDSTNVFVPGEAGSEAEIRENLAEVVGRYKERVAIACFASNVARVESAVHAAMATGRRAALIGRSLWRMTEVAQACGYLQNIPPFLTEHDIGYLPRNEVLLICTGSQGEQGAALPRIAANEHPNVVLDRGDVVLFSSRKIPGNEKAIYKVQNQLARRGVSIVTDKEERIHVSGHPARDELARMYHWVRPRIAVPMHGESRHLIEHADFARKAGAPEVMIVTNGDCLQIAPGNAKIVGRAPTGRLGLDGSRLIALDDRLLSARKRMTFNGSALVTVVLDRKGRLMADPQVSTQGLLDAQSGDTTTKAAVAAAQVAVEKLARDDREDDAAVEDAVRLAVQRSLKAARGKRPLTQVHVVRV
jgi:ribonuclease J